MNTQEQAEKLANQLKAEGWTLATLSEDDLHMSIETFGYACTVDQLRAALNNKV